jgi:hypothetical protein
LVIATSLSSGLEQFWKRLASIELEVHLATTFLGLVEEFLELADMLLVNIEHGTSLVSEGSETLDFAGDGLGDVPPQDVPDEAWTIESRV